MPIGSNAQYVPANIKQATSWGMTEDEDIIILTPNAPLTAIMKSEAGWDSSKDRCKATGGMIQEAPIPADYVLGSSGGTPNNSAAILAEDGRTFLQNQPFVRCEAGGSASSWYTFPNEDLYGLGMYGAHGGSGLSSIGGTIRLGELVPGGNIPHVMKVNLFADRNLYYSDADGGYRWPAPTDDSYAANNYKGKNPELRMGSLLAIPPNIADEMVMLTEPGKILLKAFRNYGGYVVDDTAWDVYALAVEQGPSGRLLDEFESEWGFPFNPQSRNSDWVKDMDLLFLNLHVVSNNSENAVGGGGTPLVPLAEPLEGNAIPKASYTANVKVGMVPFTIELNASSSTDLDGDNLVYHWDFKDGETLETNEPLINHTYTNTGFYRPSLKVTDGELFSSQVEDALINVQGTDENVLGSNHAQSFGQFFDENWCNVTTGESLAVKCLNMSGSLLDEFKLGHGECLDLTDYPSGIVLISVIKGRKVSMQKVLVNK